MTRRATIAVTGTGSLIGQAIIKSIQRSELSGKVNIIGFDYFKETVGSYWCASNYILPDILKPTIAVEQWLEFIIKTLLTHNVELLFVGVDFELPLFSKYKAQIESETGAIVMVSSEEVISIANDKYLTYKFLKDNNLFYPESFLPEDFGESKFDFPVIVKPRNGARSVGVNKVSNMTEMEFAMKSIQNPVIQECVGNISSEFTCGTIFLGGELKKMIILNRSLKEGNTFISRYRKDYPEIISEYLADVCKILKPFGACNFQLRLDSKGIPKIFEINSRHSGTTYIRSLFGYLEIEYIINYILEGVETHFELREGTVVRYFDEFYLSQ